MQAIQKRKQGIIEDSENLWSAPGTDLRVVFVQGDIPPPR